MESYLGIITGCTTAVPLDAALPCEDLIDLLNRSDSAALFLSPKLKPYLDAFLENCPKLQKVWMLQEEVEDAPAKVYGITVASFFIYGKIPMWHFFVAIYFHIWNYPFRTWDRARFREPARGCAPALGTPCPAQSGARPASSARRCRFAGVSSRGARERKS